MLYYRDKKRDKGRGPEWWQTWLKIPWLWCFSNHNILILAFQPAKGRAADNHAGSYLTCQIYDLFFFFLPLSSPFRFLLTAARTGMEYAREGVGKGDKTSAFLDEKDGWEFTLYLLTFYPQQPGDSELVWKLPSSKLRFISAEPFPVCVLWGSMWDVFRLCGQAFIIASIIDIF